MKWLVEAWHPQTNELFLLGVEDGVIIGAARCHPFWPLFYKVDLEWAKKQSWRVVRAIPDEPDGPEDELMGGKWCSPPERRDN